MPDAENRSPLSNREREILELLVTGATNLQIAGQLTISPNTVKVHLRNIYEKMGVQSRTEASMLAVREGWVTLDGAPPVSTPAARAAPVTAVPPSLALWQRIYFVAALVLVVLALGYLQLTRGSRTTAQTSDLIDPPAVADLAGIERSATQWVERAPMPMARSRLALVAHNDRLYAIGGATPAGVSSLVEVYDPESNGWLPLASKPTAVSNVGAAVVNGLIFVPGGYTAEDETTNALEAYDPQRDTWMDRAPLLQPVCAYAISAAAGRIYLFGGWTGADYSASVQVYDSQSDRWFMGWPFDEPRGFAAAATFEDAIYVAGGYDGTTEFSRVDAYDLTVGEGVDPWMRRSDMAAPRGGLGIAATEDALYAIGGGWTVPSDFGERYDPSSDTWSSIPMPLASTWRNVGVAALGGRVFAVGGWSGGHLALNEEYRTLRYFLPLGAKSNGD